MKLQCIIIIYDNSYKLLHLIASTTCPCHVPLLLYWHFQRLGVVVVHWYCIPNSASHHQRLLLVRTVMRVVHYIAMKCMCYVHVLHAQCMRVGMSGAGLTVPGSFQFYSFQIGPKTVFGCFLRKGVLWFVQNRNSEISTELKSGAAITPIVHT